MGTKIKIWINSIKETRMRTVVIAVVLLAFIMTSVGGQDVVCSRETKADITFLLDSSGSIRDNNPTDGSYDNWNLVLTFLADIVERLSIGENSVRIAVVKFANRGNIEFRLNRFYDKSVMRREILRIRYAGGNTNTSGGIFVTRTQVYDPTNRGNNGDRSDVQNILIIVTDGKSTRDPERTIPYANEAKAQGFRILVVGITELVNRTELAGMSSTGIENQTYWMSTDFRVLTTIINSIVTETCRTLPPVRTTPLPFGCRNAVTDLAILVDSSGSIRDANPKNPNTGRDIFDNWTEGVLRFMEKIVERLPEIGPAGTQVAVVKFANRGNLEFGFRDHNSKSQLLNSIRNIGYAGGNTNTSGGIYVAMKQVFGARNGDRSFAPNVVIILTDGKATRDKHLTQSYAEELKRLVPRVLVVGITNLINETELRMISSSPQRRDETYWLSPDFSTGLNAILDSLLVETCRLDCAHADFALLVDASGSIRESNPIGFDNWNDGIINFMEQLVTNLDIGRDESLVSVTKFANSGELLWDFNEYQDKSSLLGAIRRIQHTGGNTNTSGGIYQLLKRVFVPSGGERTNRRNIVLILTDGKSTRDMEKTIPFAQELQRIATVFVIGITNLIDENEIRRMSSTQIEGDTYFRSTDFRVLDAALKSFLQQFCATSPPIPSTTPFPTGLCSNRVDLLFIFDSSGSIGETNFARARSFVVDIVQELPINNGQVRVALIQFSTNANVVFYLDRYGNKPDMLAAIRSLQYIRGTTNTGAAIRMAANEVFNNGRGDRSDVANVVVLMTDGGSNNKEDTVASALRAKTSNQDYNKVLHIIVVGITKWIDRNELISVASHPYQQNMIEVRDFSGLNNNLKDRIRRMICNNDNECIIQRPCRNGAECVDMINMYYCRCPNGFSGINCEYRCRKPREDVIFTMDSSGSIGRDNFLKMMEFAKLLAMDVATDSGSRVGLLTFGTNHKIHAHLNTMPTKMMILNKFSVPFFSAGTTNTAGAIKSAYSEMFTPGNGDQNNADNVDIIFTDGRSDSYIKTWEEARNARNRKIHLITVGIGNNLRKWELETMATGMEANVFKTSDFDNFESIRDGLRNAICDNQNECASNPCRNGAECIDGIGYYRCNCRIGFNGVNCERRCSGEADVVFMLDRSGSIRNERFPFLMQYVVNVVSQMDVGTAKTRVGVASFADNAKVEFMLNSYTTKQDTLMAIHNIKWTGGKTNMASGFEMITNQLFSGANGDRPNVPNQLIVVSDGNSNIREAETLPQSIRTRISGVHIVSVSVGSDSNMMELRGIASLPVEKNVYHVRSFTELPNLETPVFKAICDEINECASNPCLNGGRCIDGLGRFICECPNDYVGERCGETCRRQYDIAFVMDLSGSVDMAYNYTIKFVQKVIHGLELRFDRIRVAAVTYSDTAVRQFNLGEYQGKLDVLNALAFPKVGGRTNTQDALRLVRDDVFQARNGDRSGVPNKVIFLTDGGSNIRPSQTIPNAQNLKNAGVEIFTVAIGDQVDMNEINGIATDPDSTHVFMVQDMNQVDSRADSLLNRLCFRNR